MSNFTSYPSALALVGDWTGCTHWRITQPMEMLARMGCNTAIADKDDPGVENVVALFDAVILPRMSWEDRGSGERFIGALHRAGICAIQEWDDDLFSPEVNKRIHLLDREASPELLELRRIDRLAALRLCDGMTVSSPRLATVMRSLVDYPVHVVPNAIDLDWWRDQLAREKRAIPGPTIGWAGGTRPDDDIVPMAQAWGRIAERYPSVNFVVYGFQPEPFTAAVPAERLYRIPWRTVSEYAGAFVNFDVGCASVADLPFNRSKTSIKCWEYAAAGAAVVASPTLYGRDVQHGHTGYLATSVDEWEWALAELVSNEPRRQRLARALYLKVQAEHSLRGNIERWPIAWLSIIASFKERAERSRKIVVAR